MLNGNLNNRAAKCRHLASFLIVFITFGTMSAQTKRALVVGISEYPQSGAETWGTIHGLTV